MSRGTVEDSRARKAAKIEAEAQALLGALNSRGRLAPFPGGTIIQQKYRIERYLRGNEARNQYVASWADVSGGRHCWECGFESNDVDADVCQECGSELGERQFMLSERWRGSFQTYLDLQDLGLFHPGLARVYDVFQDGQRLFTLSELVSDHFINELSSPFSAAELVEMLSRGAETLEYLHTNGVKLQSLGKEHVLIRGAQLFLHDLEVSQIYGKPLEDDARRDDFERLARILREFTPAELPDLRWVFDQACDGQFIRAQELISRARDALRKLPRQPSPHEVAGMSDVGMLRTLNEDHWGWEKLSDELWLYAVADGMGGHDSGEVASELAVNTLLAGARRRLAGRVHLDEESLEKLLDQSFQEANKAIKDFANARRSDMGTTLVATLIYKNQTAFVANVGDSRAYLYRASQLHQVSQDHSLVANLVAMGKISKETAKNHPHSNILIRTVGKEYDVEIDIFRQALQPGDLFLLCSDGLWGEVDDSEITALIQSQSALPPLVQKLIKNANNNGGHDNITALLVRV